MTTSNSTGYWKGYWKVIEAATGGVPEKINAYNYNGLLQTYTLSGDLGPDEIFEPNGTFTFGALILWVRDRFC